MSKILIDEATVTLALELLAVATFIAPKLQAKRTDVINAGLKALAEQPAQQGSTCNNTLRIQGKGYPRTCKKCGFGPCVELANTALDKKAENAKELGLDYEPLAGTQVSKVWWDGEKLMAKPIPFVEFYKPVQQEPDNSNYRLDPPGLDPLYTTPPAQRTWFGLDWLPKHKCGLHLSHNDHRDVYEKVEVFYEPDDFISPEEWHKAVAEDSVWVLHWYPNTPVGFIRIAASTLEAIEAKLKEKNEM